VDNRVAETETGIGHERITRNHRRVFGACLHCNAPSFLTPKTATLTPEKRLQFHALGVFFFSPLSLPSNAIKTLPAGVL